MTTDPERYCPCCAAVAAFEHPPCPDGHDDCPDQACTRCGTALFVGVVSAAFGPDALTRAGSAEHPGHRQ